MQHFINFQETLIEIPSPTECPAKVAVLPVPDLGLHLMNAMDTQWNQCVKELKNRIHRAVENQHLKDLQRHAFTSNLQETHGNTISASNWAWPMVSRPSKIGLIPPWQKARRAVNLNVAQTGSNRIFVKAISESHAAESRWASQTHRSRFHLDTEISSANAKTAGFLLTRGLKILQL